MIFAIRAPFRTIFKSVISLFYYAPIQTFATSQNPAQLPLESVVSGIAFEKPLARGDNAECFQCNKVEQAVP